MSVLPNKPKTITKNTNNPSTTTKVLLSHPKGVYDNLRLDGTSAIEDLIKESINDNNESISHKKRYKYVVCYGIDYITYFDTIDEIIEFSKTSKIRQIVRNNTSPKYKNMCFYDWTWYDGVKSSTIIKHYYSSIADYGFNPIDNDDSKLIKHFNLE